MMTLHDIEKRLRKALYDSAKFLLVPSGHRGVL